MESRLAPEDIKELISKHRMQRNRKDADKIKCLILWGKGWSWELIKEALLLSDGTIKGYIDLYKSKGIEGLLERHQEGHNYKLTVEQEQMISIYIDNNNVLNSKQVCQYVKARFGIKYSVNGMTQTLKRLGFSYKKPKRRPGGMDKELQERFKESYETLSKELPVDESLYFVDGAGFEHNTKIDYGWMRKGKTKEIKTNSGRKRINTNGAYDPKTGNVLTIREEVTLNADSNIKLFEKLIEKDFDKRKITIILDNAKMNKGKILQQFIKEQNSKGLGPEIELYYLPTYSPNLNLIERLWRFVKKKLLSNQYYPTFDRFKQAIDNFFNYGILKYKKELKRLMVEDFQSFECVN
jgi:transposase